MSLHDPDLLFPAWRQHCLDDAMDLVDRVLFTGQAQTQPGLRPAWQDRLNRLIEAPRHAGAFSAAPAAPAAQDLSTLSGLVLMSDDEVNENIASRRLVQQLDGSAEWVLRDLDARCSLWRWQAEQAGFAQPLLLEPAALAQTLCEALNDCVPHPPRRLALLTELSPALTREAPALYQRQLDWLDSQGVEAQPLLLRPVPPGRGGEPATALSAAAQTGAALAVTVEQVPALLARVAAQAQLSQGMAGLLARLAPLVQGSLQAHPQLLHAQDGAVWRLIDRLVSLSQLDPASSATPDRPALDQRLTPLINALMDQPGPLGPQHYERALAHADRLAMASLPEAVGTSSHASRTLNLQARQLELEPLIRSQMVERVAPLDLLPGARQFLLGPWVQVLTHASARDGVDAPSTQRWAGLIDSLVDGAARHRRRPLSPAELDCQLLDAADGLRDAGLPSARITQHLDDLRAELAHWPRMAPAHTDEVPALAAELTEAERNSLMPPGSPDIDDSDWQHHADLATVPVDLQENDPNTPAALARRAWMASLAPSQLCRIFLQGRWTSVRLDWISEGAQFFAFSRRRGPAFSTSRRVLERLRAEGLVTTIDPGQWLREAASTLPGAL
jgi:hypothetical protein